MRWVGHVIYLRFKVQVAILVKTVFCNVLIHLINIWNGRVQFADVGSSCSFLYKILEYNFISEYRTDFMATCRTGIPSLFRGTVPQYVKLCGNDPCIQSVEIFSN